MFERAGALHLIQRDFGVASAGDAGDFGVACAGDFGDAGDFVVARVDFAGDFVVARVDFAGDFVVAICVVSSSGSTTQPWLFVFFL